MSEQKAVVVSEKIGVTINPFEVVQTLVEYGDKWVVEGLYAINLGRRGRSLVTV